MATVHTPVPPGITEHGHVDLLAKIVAQEHGRGESAGEFGSPRGEFGIDMAVGQLDGMVDGKSRRTRLDAHQIVATLPAPRVRGQDPSCALLANLPHTQPRHTLELLRRITVRSQVATNNFEVEVSLQAIRALLELGHADMAQGMLDALRSTCIGDWRIAWFTGIAALVQADYRRAYRQFDIVRVMLPDEPTPSLAMAATAELLLLSRGARADAAHWRRAAIDNYGRAWRPHREIASAAFGLARMLTADGDVRSAVAVLDELPVGSPHRDTAGLTGCLLHVGGPAAELTETDLRVAAGRLASLSDSRRYLPTRLILLWTALVWLESGGRLRNPETSIFGTPNTVAGLRHGVEAGLRQLARVTTDAGHRIRLVDLANGVRPRTWF
ncbi:tetratricopeptide repeat protein [Nocardia miyunensis]|uniref:tetratricopeptide repeat protein n=1 Tax=Nocardia miyunensis TaxID=282684 RepID=UPI000AD71262|nr:tetratricopeptide repeat protein [Nocardia miyunensis]